MHPSIAGTYNRWEYSPRRTVGWPPDHPAAEEEGMAFSPTLGSQGCLLLLSVNHWLLIQETEKKMTQKKKINPLCMRFRPGQSR